jgi:hypothetical protein
VFGHFDLGIILECHENRYSYSELGLAYGEGPEANTTTLFGQMRFRVSDNEVFKIVVTENASSEKDNK